MTLAIALANADHVIHVSDRRVTRGGEVVDDDRNKTGHVICADVSFVYSFSGIAKVSERHRGTSSWLLETFSEATREGITFLEIVHEAAALATRHFRMARYVRRLALSDQRLSILLTGYTCDGHIASGLISNYQDWVGGVDHGEAQPQFRVFMQRSRMPASENDTSIQRIGVWQRVNVSVQSELRQMLVERRPLNAIVDKAVSVIRDAAAHPIDGGAVGQKVNSLALSANDPLSPICNFTSDKIENYFPMADFVDLRNGRDNLQLSDIRITADGPTFFPRVHRNARCPCGSDLQYKKCHGAIRR